MPIEGSEFTVEADTVIVAIGQKPSYEVIEGIDTSPERWIQVDEQTMATSIEGIYAGGDLVNGGDTAVRAVGDGKRAAFAIDEYIRGKMSKLEPSHT